MQEWVKDLNAGYFCVSYLARRLQTADGSEDRLDFYTWIAEYDDPDQDETSLGHMQLVKENSSTRKHYIQFSEIKDTLSKFETTGPAALRSTT